MESARPATAADVGRLAELAEQAIAELTPTKGGDIWARREARRAPYDESFISDLADDDRLVLVGEIQGAVIGYAVVHIEPLRDDGSLGIINDIYVEPDARDVGVGECLMDAIVAWCSARECVGIDGLALPGNRATKNFFETFGLVARAIVVHRRLDGHEPDAP
jgi:GNAT superfamily N-acetyltransferase